MHQALTIPQPTILRAAVVSLFVIAAPHALGDPADSNGYSHIRYFGSNDYPPKTGALQLAEWAKPWAQDFTTAKIKAIGNNLDLLIYFEEDFTRLQSGHPLEHFLRTAEFHDFASRSLSLLEFTRAPMPRVAERAKTASPDQLAYFTVSPQRQQEYKRQRSRFTVETPFDSGAEGVFILCDYQNRPIMRTEQVSPKWVSYDLTGREVRKFIGTFQAAQSRRKLRDNLLAEAADLEGVDKARRIGRALQVLDLEDPIYLRFYRPELDKMLAADPTAAHPLASRILSFADSTKRFDKTTWPEMLRAFERGARDEFLEIAADALRTKDYHPFQRQILLACMVSEHQRRGESGKALQYLKQCQHLDPESSLVKSGGYEKLKHAVQSNVDEDAGDPADEDN